MPIRGIINISRRKFNLIRKLNPKFCNSDFHIENSLPQICFNVKHVTTLLICFLSVKLSSLFIPIFLNCMKYLNTLNNHKPIYYIIKPIHISHVSARLYRKKKTNSQALKIVHIVPKTFC